MLKCFRYVAERATRKPNLKTKWVSFIFFAALPPHQKEKADYTTGIKFHFLRLEFTIPPHFDTTILWLYLCNFFTAAHIKIANIHGIGNKKLQIAGRTSLA